jgi:DNA-binding NarL/FixJ family response regulator
MLSSKMREHLPKYETGCEYYPQCESCPYPDCLLDVKLPNVRTAMRRAQIAELVKKGHSTGEIAEMLRCSQRTVRRYRTDVT